MLFLLIAQQSSITAVSLCVVLCPDASAFIRNRFVLAPSLPTVTKTMLASRKLSGITKRVGLRYASGKEVLFGSEVS